MERKLFSSGAPWEAKVGYSRAVKVGPWIEVSGTTAMDGDQLVGKGDAYQQTHFILSKISKVLEEAESSMEAVVRTRMFVADISQWEAIGRAHGEFFRDVRPAATMVEAKLIDPELLVEIEVSAYQE